MRVCHKLLSEYVSIRQIDWEVSLYTPSAFKYPSFVHLKVELQFLFFKLLDPVASRLDSLFTQNSICSFSSSVVSGPTILSLVLQF